jgi:hypothetical protein
MGAFGQPHQQPVAQRRGTFATQADVGDGSPIHR